MEPRAPRAGVRKPPREETAGMDTWGGAARAMGIWTRRARRVMEGDVIQRIGRWWMECYRHALMTATLVLSGTSSAGTPPIAANAPTWALIQSPSPCVHVACA